MNLIPIYKLMLSFALPSVIKMRFVSSLIDSFTSIYCFQSYFDGSIERINHHLRCETIFFLFSISTFFSIQITGSLVKNSKKSNVFFSWGFSFCIRKMKISLTIEWYRNWIDSIQIYGFKCDEMNCEQNSLQNNTSAI